MPSYENEKCPVCGEKFKDGDDIVTCPECGTPHHRECYKKIGHCINEDKHASGYEFKKTGVSNNAQNVPSESAEKQNAPVGTYFDPNASNNENQNNQNTAESKSNTKKCVSCGADINKTLLSSFYDFPFSLVGIISGIAGLVMIFAKNKDEKDK